MIRHGTKTFFWTIVELESSSSTLCQWNRASLYQHKGMVIIHSLARNENAFDKQRHRIEDRSCAV